MVQTIKNELLQQGDREKADILLKFFQAFPGGYGEGDQFIGVTVPNQRKIARRYSREISMEDLETLLQDPVHECRLTALFMMISKFERSTNAQEKEELVRCYLDNLSYVNNWDLVDSSAYKILGPYLENTDRQLLYALALSQDLWKQRIAIISTLHYIRRHDFRDTLQIAEILLDHSHDLVHKAVGWMIREVGNRDVTKAVEFLNKHYRAMSRTTLRYAIEKFDPAMKEHYLKGTV